jgi:hypothetical protein
MPVKRTLGPSETSEASEDLRVLFDANFRKASLKAKLTQINVEQGVTPRFVQNRTMRPSRTWGSCRAAKWTTGMPFCNSVIVLQGTVHHCAADLEHQVHTTWRPEHLLLSDHPAM